MVTLYIPSLSIESPHYRHCTPLVCCHLLSRESSFAERDSIPQIENSGWVYSINANTTFYITPSFSVQANVNYLSRRPTAQGEDSRYLIPNLSVKKSFFDNRLTASIHWQNIDLGMHQTNRQRITTRGEDFYTTTNYIYETDVVMLNLSYSINFNKATAKLPTSEFGEKEFYSCDSVLENFLLSLP